MIEAQTSSMHDNWLVAFALIVSALGIASLLFCLIIMEVPLSTIPQAQQSDDGAAVQVSGTVVKTTQRGGMTITTITQPATIDVIIDGNTTTLPEAGDCIVVRGKKGSYNDAAQISASRISKCKEARR